MPCWASLGLSGFRLKNGFWKAYGVVDKVSFPMASPFRRLETNPIGMPSQTIGDQLGKIDPIKLVVTSLFG
jgi:hypothetical protein